MIRQIGLVVVLLVSVVAFAQPQRMQMRDGKGPGPARMMEELKLNESQKTQMQKMHINLMKKQTQLHAKIQGLRLDTKELFLADKVDRKAIENNIKAVNEVQEQLKLNKLDHWFAVNAILTPDQQKLWKDVPMHMGKGKGAGRGMRMRERGMWGDRFDNDLDD